MWKRLITVWILIILASKLIPCQTPDGYDTLYTRGNGYILCPKYDTIKQLDTANKKADKILSDLQKIMAKLNINDTIK